MEEKNVTERLILKREPDRSLVLYQVLATTLRIIGPNTTNKIVKAYNTDVLAGTLR